VLAVVDAETHMKVGCERLRMRAYPDARRKIALRIGYNTDRMPVSD